MDIEKIDKLIGQDPSKAVQFFRQLKGEKAIKEMQIIKEELEKSNAITIFLEKVNYIAEGIFNFVMDEPVLVRSEKTTSDQRVIEFELGKLILNPDRRVDFLPNPSIHHLKITDNEKVVFEIKRCREEKISLGLGKYSIIADQKKLFIEVRL